MEVYSSLNRDGGGRVRKKHYRIITSLCSVAIMFMKELNANFGGHTIICIYTTIYMHACLHRLGWLSRSCGWQYNAYQSIAIRKTLWKIR